MTDTLQYKSTANNYTSRYYFQLTGNISSEGGAFFTIQHADNTPQSYSFFDTGNINQLIVSDAYVHGVSPQRIRYTLQSFVQTNTEFSDGASISGAANFENTLELVGIELRDAETGEILTNAEITSSSPDNGGQNRIEVVPEPSCGLVALATCGLWMARRQRVA